MKIKSLLVSLFSLVALGAFSAEAIVVDGIAYAMQSNYYSVYGGDLCYITERPDGQKYEDDIVNHMIKLYVPGDSLGLYIKKSKDGDSNDIRTGSGDWGNFIGYSIKKKKEVGLDERDDTEELYNRIYWLRYICSQQQVIVDSLSRDAYNYYCFYLDSLIGTEGGETSLEVEAKKYNDYFEWVEIEDEWSGKTRLFPYIPELYRIVNGITTQLALAEDRLNELYEPRLEYYKMKEEYESLQAKAEEARIKAENAQKEAESSQDEDKKLLAEELMMDYQNIKAYADRYKEELDSTASELFGNVSLIRNIIDYCAYELVRIIEYDNDILEEEYHKFLNTLMDVIASVPTITDDVNKKAEQWYSPDGRRLSQKPTKAGLYIINGKKLIVK